MCAKIRQAFCLLLCLAVTVSSHGESNFLKDKIFQDVILVTGTRQPISSETISADVAPAIAPDAAYLVGRLPGAALNNNGRLSGQIQYRGAHGSRIGTKINGQNFHSGGPNLMDPPMHYAPPPLVESIEVSRGASAVAFGPSLVGGISTMLKTVDYGETSAIDFHYDLTAIGRSADASHALGGTFGVSNDRFKLFTSVSTEEGNDVGFPGGDIENTFHDRLAFGLTGVYRGDDGELSLEFRRQETGPTGNPPFAMDIRLVETDFVNLRFSKTLANLKWSGSIGYSDVDHEMTNFELRKQPASPGRFRLTVAAAKTLVASFGTKLEVGENQLQLEIDSSSVEKSARISNPNNPNFFVDSLPGIKIDRFGVFADWTKSVAAFDMSVGVRVDQHEAEAGLATTGAAVPMMPAMLSMQFNQSDRKWKATTTDLVLRAWKEIKGNTWRASLARKNRVPSYIELFAWLPTPASAGLADGNNYVGDRNLDEETVWILEAGIDINRDGWWLRPTIYYHHVEDYIQGISYDDTPGVIDSTVEMVSNMNGDSAPLRFANVDAKMYGFDTDYGIQLSSNWRIEGVVSVVRGERRDINDNLYRISPDRFSLGLIYERNQWMVNLESVLVGEQDNISRTNSEQWTPGHGLLNLYTHWRAKAGLLLSLGFENILDHEYHDHLSGYNRIADSDIAVGERLPGTGRNVYLRLQLRR